MAIPSPVQSAPFTQEPGYHAPTGLWLYGNVRLIDGYLEHVAEACGSYSRTPKLLDFIAKLAEQMVLGRSILVCGIHTLAHRRAAVVPLRYGSPRVVVFPGGFRWHLGPELKNDPYEAEGLWRFGWDAQTDLAISLREPDAEPLYGADDEVLDKLIEEIARGTRRGLSSVLEAPKSQRRSA